MDTNLTLKGFSPEFKDLTDYILKITYAIWENRGLDKINDWYGKTAPVYTPTSVTRKVEDVIKFTLQTLHMFPDRQLFGEDMIGCAYPNQTYFSSHRILSTMTHMGDGAFGEPTGNEVKTRVIADCVCRNNIIIEEWMVRDQSAIIIGVGLDVEAFGRAQGKALKKAKALLSPEAYVSLWDNGKLANKDIRPAKPAPYTQHIIDAMKDIFENNNIKAIKDIHDRAANAYFPGSIYVDGIDEITDYLVSLNASFPKGKFSPHHWIEVKEEEEPVRISLRWTYKTTHSGFGLYGEPSNAPLTIMAISHFELRKGKILRAFHIYDELSMWGQIEVNKK